jgi:hypothetical protein
MKKLNILLAFCLTIIILNAQTPPNAFNYSAVARNPSGVPIANSAIGIQITILKSSPTGTSEYVENHVVNSDEFGLFNLIIGGGAVQSGSIENIDWSSDSYYLQVGMDVSGGVNFVLMGTTQLLSVPYALHAKTAENVVNTNSVVTFFAVSGSGQLATNTSQQIILNNNNTNVYNPNNYYNSATGEYTVPKNGTYIFTLAIVYAGTGVIKKNGIDQLVLPDANMSYSLAYSVPKTIILPSLIEGDVITFWADGWADMGGPFGNFSGRIYGYRID